MKPPHSELRFASFLSYCPRGDAEEIRASQKVIRQLKENRVVRVSGSDEAIADMVARRIRETQASFSSEFFSAAVSLVPIPRSALRKEGALWPALELADSLLASGFGAQVLPCLTRARAVQKAATSRSEDRTKARGHFDSLEVLSPLSIPAEVTLVDDVVTSGAQLFGAACRIWAARPDVVVRAFAVVRTISDPAHFVAIRDPRTGRISWLNERCRRDP